MGSAQLKDTIKGKPEIAKIYETDEGHIYMTWSETPGAQKFIVEKFNRETQHFEKIAHLEEDVFEYLDENVEAAGVYRYRIAAKRKTGNKDIIVKRGSAVSVSVSSLNTVELCDVSHPSFGVATLTWEKDENADGYRINRRLSLTSHTLPLDYVEGQTLKYTDKTAISGQIYFYSVQSFRRCEDDELVFSKAGKEKMIVNLDETEITSIKKGREKTVSFKVRVTASIDSYVLFRSDSEDGEYTEVARSKSGIDTTLSDKGEKKKKGAYYTVKCMRSFEDTEYFSEGTKPVFVKY